MACTIHAWLENGEPRLQVLDCHSGHLRMAWKPRKHQQELNSSDVRSLFRALLDVSVIEQLANTSAAAPKHHKATNKRSHNE